MTFLSVTVFNSNLIGSPIKFKRFAAVSVIKLHVAQLSNKQSMGPSVVDIVCIESKTLGGLATKSSATCVECTDAMKGVEAP